MKLFVFISIVFLGFSSCKKGKAEVTLKGVVTDTSFGLPLSGASIEIYQVESGSSDELIGQSTTNANGEYSFVFDRDQTESYRITSSKANYYDLDESISFSDITIEEDNVYNFSTTAKSWVSLNFTNSGGVSTDQLKYIKQSGKSGCGTCCPDDPQFLNGLIDTTIIYANDGNSLFSYQYFVVGTSDQGLKSATTTAFDTTAINLVY
jgi:5-hydroxyisourate hydrolase-like protein (transthyretin family)